MCLNSIRKMVKTTKAFSRKLAVPRYMSASVCPKLMPKAKKFKNRKSNSVPFRPLC